MTLINTHDMTPIHWSKGYKYRLEKDFRCMVPILGYDIETPDGMISMDTKGCLDIRRGWAWDGASSLTVDTRSSFRGSLIHDALYKLFRLELLPISYRPLADAILMDVCIIDGMWQFRAGYWFQAVRAGGLESATKKRKVYAYPKQKGK